MFELGRYTIRRKVFKLFGASFHVFDEYDRVVGFSSQKAFRLKEDIRVYQDETKTRELLVIQARQIVDFSAAYDIVDPTEGRAVGVARRRGFRSLVRDSWEILDPEERLAARLGEDSTFLALLRRFLSNLIPQGFSLNLPDGRQAAELRVHFNPFVYRLSVRVEGERLLDPRLVLGVAVLVAAVEGRQR